MAPTFSRAGTFVVGTILLTVAVGLNVATRDTIVSVVIVLAGCALIVYAMVWDRFQSFGPSSGLTLFERIKEDVAKGVETTVILDTIRNEAVPYPPEVQTQTPSAQAAALIRQASTPEELADALVSIVNQPESRAEGRARQRADRAADALDDRAGDYG